MKIKSTWMIVLKIAIEELQENGWWEKNTKTLKGKPINELTELLIALDKEQQREVSN